MKIKNVKNKFFCYCSKNSTMSGIIFNKIKYHPNYTNGTGCYHKHKPHKTRYKNRNNI